MAFSGQLAAKSYPDSHPYSKILHTDPNGKGWLIKTEKPTGYMVAKDGSIIQSFNSRNYEEDDPGYRTNQQTTLANYAGAQDVKGLGFSYQDVAPNINIAELQKYIDPNSGQIIDRDGMLNYMKTLPGLADKNFQELNAYLKDMPDMSMDQGDVRSARAKQQSDIYGLQSKIGESRQKAETAAGASGVYSPTASGFGVGDESAAQGIYGQLGETQAAGADTYGLGEKKEEQFGQWVASLIE